MPSHSLVHPKKYVSLFLAKLLLLPLICLTACTTSQSQYQPSAPSGLTIRPTMYGYRPEHLKCGLDILENNVIIAKAQLQNNSSTPLFLNIREGRIKVYDPDSGKQIDTKPEAVRRTSLDPKDIFILKPGESKSVEFESYAVPVSITGFVNVSITIPPLSAESIKLINITKAKQTKAIPNPTEAKTPLEIFRLK